MYRTLLLFILLLHIAGDYYLQTDSIAAQKKTSPSGVFRHGMLYAIPLVLLAVYWSVQALVLAALIWGLHLIIDFLKYYLIQSAKNAPEAVVYCLDQTLHLMSVLAIVYFVKELVLSFAFPAAVESFFLPLNITIHTILRWLVLLLFILKPANITIKILTTAYRPPDDPAAKPNAGAFIGTLERVLIALLLSVSQYAAIGLVLTAKSVARYEKLKNQSFAEYYLLGTLLSALLAVAAYLLLFAI